MGATGWGFAVMSGYPVARKGLPDEAAASGAARAWADATMAGAAKVAPAQLLPENLPPESMSVADMRQLIEQRLALRSNSPVELVKAYTAVAQGRDEAAERAKQRRQVLTLRLDADRHLRLCLAATRLGRTAEDMLVDALDRLLDGEPAASDTNQTSPRKASGQPSRDTLNDR
jgi:hypothetical protein